jgi:hypothetical protein
MVAWLLARHHILQGPSATPPSSCGQDTLDCRHARLVFSALLGRMMTSTKHHMLHRYTQLMYTLNGSQFGYGLVLATHSLHACMCACHFKGAIQHAATNAVVLNFTCVDLLWHGHMHAHGLSTARLLLHTKSWRCFGMQHRDQHAKHAQMALNAFTCLLCTGLCCASAEHVLLHSAHQASHPMHNTAH